MVLDRLFEVVPDDDADQLDGVPFVLYVGTSGSVAVLSSRGDEVTFDNLAAGMFHPFFVRRVLDTGTTAANIVGGRD